MLHLVFNKYGKTFERHPNVHFLPGAWNTRNETEAYIDILSGIHPFYCHRFCKNEKYKQTNEVYKKNICYSGLYSLVRIY